MREPAISTPIGSAAADIFTGSHVITKRAEGLTPRFWDSYAPFHFIVLTNG